MQAKLLDGVASLNATLFFCRLGKLSLVIVVAIFHFSRLGVVVYICISISRDERTTAVAEAHGPGDCKAQLAGVVLGYHPWQGLRCNGGEQL